MSARLGAALACVNATHEERWAVQGMAHEILAHPDACEAHKQQARDTLDGIDDALSLVLAVEWAFAHSDT